MSAAQLPSVDCSQNLLLTNNPGGGDGDRPLETPINPHDKRYLTTKAPRSGHRLLGLKTLAAEISRGAPTKSGLPYSGALR